MNRFKADDPVLPDWLFFTFSFVFLVSGSPVSADTIDLSVHAENCVWLDYREIERLVKLEIGDAVEPGAKLPPAGISLSCDRNSVQLIVHDASGAVRIERDVPFPELKGKGRERQVAIAIAQFVADAWRSLELEPAVEPEPDEAEESEPEEVGKTIEVFVGGGANLRSLQTSNMFLTGGAEAMLTGWVAERVGIAGLVSYERGEENRESGVVVGNAGSAGVGVIYRFSLASDVLSLDTALNLSAGFARLEGSPKNDNYVGSDSQGLIAQGCIEVAPVLHLGRLTIVIFGRGGYALRSVVATVAGEKDVSFGGVWTGLGARLGISFEI